MWYWGWGGILCVYILFVCFVLFCLFGVLGVFSFVLFVCSSVSVGFFLFSFFFFSSSIDKQIP